MEALDAVTGEVRWSKVVSSNDAVVTSSHLVAVDVDSRGDGPSTVSGYLLSDGTLDWSVDVDSSTYPPYHLFVAGDRVYAPIDGDERLVEIDSSHGRIRRTMDPPSPGKGGKWSEHGAVRGIVLDEA
ncbi:MAG: PQQ-binding-like beta-propeller repeat protein, partial [Acidimicrobiia bacterium]|nr:PQQ-binding-like beta-propeller repeat protein [Acidimicrobiia bacterium]